MLLENIQEYWEQDSQIDRMNLAEESLKIPKLHSKYYKILIQEALQLKKYDSDLKVLKLEKFEFYTQGPSKETHQKGWEMPLSGRILKSEVNTYLEADKDIIKATLKVAYQKEKVDFVDSILKEISQRSFHISNCIKYEVFRAGG